MRHDQRGIEPVARRPAGGSVAGQRGFTLIELMISSALAVVVLAGAVAALFAAGRLQRNQEIISDASREARAALREVSRRLTMGGAGSYGLGGGLKAITYQDGPTALGDFTGPQRPDTLTLLVIDADRRTDLVSGFSGTVLDFAADFRTNANSLIFQVGGAVLVTNYVRSDVLTINAVVANGDYTRLTLNEAAVTTRNNVEIQPGASAFPIEMRRYRVCASWVTSGDYLCPATLNTAEGEFYLVRDTLNPITGTVIYSRAVARGVEDFQVEWGDGTNFGSSFDETNSAYARISVSARTRLMLIDDSNKDLVGQSTEVNPFERGIDMTGAVGQDGFRRRVLTTVVALKNYQVANY